LICFIRLILVLQYIYIYFLRIFKILIKMADLNTKLDALIDLIKPKTQPKTQPQPKPVKSASIVFVIIFLTVYGLFLLIRFVPQLIRKTRLFNNSDVLDISPPLLKNVYTSTGYININPYSLKIRNRVQNMLKEYSKIEARHAKAQAKQIKRDRNTGTLYSVCDPDGGHSRNVYFHDEVGDNSRWIELHGHFIQVYHNNQPSNLHVMPYETVAQIMNKLNLADGSVLVYKDDELRNFDQTLLEYGIPDNQKIILQVQDLFDLDYQSLSSL
jgi:hypothetical protein